MGRGDFAEWLVGVGIQSKIVEKLSFEEEEIPLVISYITLGRRDFAKCQVVVGILWKIWKNVILLEEEGIPVLIPYMTRGRMDSVEWLEGDGILWND